jgi:hypothetical protein
MTAKTALIFATTAAIALASFDLRPAVAAPEGGPAIVKQKAGADEFSSQRRRRGRGVAPLAAFGAIIGTIGAIAAANRHREVYYGGPYYYAEPQYVPAPQYYVAPQYHVAPQPYVHHHRHVAPAPRHYGHHHAGPRHYPLGSFQGGPVGGGRPQVAPQAAPNDGRL